MEHGPELNVVLVLSVALALGAATRTFLARIRIPYTVLMLLFGLGGGWAIEHAADPAVGGTLLQAIESGTKISPELILFVFLPAIVFESAYGLDVHTFRRNVGAAATLAVPAMLAATALTAAWMSWLVPGAWGWSLPAAIAFGALISATDPVAVVALLRELGISKRLAALIEGESLLNDGSAIVVFSVVLELMTAQTHAPSVGAMLAEFVVVVAGGLAVGLGLAMVASIWLGRVFNDPLVEITVTVVLGYAAMILAEAVLHVSGIMAVVMAGLWMSGPGHTRLSPEVWQFVHRFWSMLAYLANTLVFFVVGLVIGTQLHDVTAIDALVIVGAWAGIMGIRFVTTFTFRPVANFLAQPISFKDGVVISWGGLRGAVSMALALMVAESAGIDDELQNKMLRVTAGVVVLTLLVNGTTTGVLLRALGYDRTPQSQKLALLGARSQVLAKVKSEMRRLARIPELRSVAWRDVEREVEGRHEARREEVRRIQRELASAPPARRAAGYWGQVLNIERESYWHAFSEGMISGTAVRFLQHELDLHYDRMEGGDLTPPATRAATRLAGFRPWVERRLRGGVRLAKFEFDNLTLLHDLSRGQAFAADRVLRELDTLSAPDSSLRNQVEDTYRSYLRRGRERIEEMRLHVPEVTRAVEVRLARRVALNKERDGYEELEAQGVLTHDTAAQLVTGVEKRMKQLSHTERRRALPPVRELLDHIPLFEQLAQEQRDRMAEHAQSIVVPAGEHLFQQGDRARELYLISRGAAHVLRSQGAEEVVVDVLGAGDVVGEMAVLAGDKRNASIRAATSLTLVRIPGSEVHALIEQEPELGDRLWQFMAQRTFDNHLRSLSRYAHLDHDARVAWFRQGRPRELHEGATAEPLDEARELLFVAYGRVRVAGTTYEAPSLLTPPPQAPIEALTWSHLVILPATASAAA